MIRSLKISLSVSLILWLCHPVWSQDSLQLPQINQDRHVLETVLDELFAGQDGTLTDHFIHQSTTSFYLPGYGLVFQAPTVRPRVIFAEHPRTAQSKRAALPQDSVKSHRAMQKDVITEILTTFLVRYGRLARSLPPGERILVYYQESDSFRHFAFQPFASQQKTPKSLSVVLSAQPAQSQVQVHREPEQEDESYRILSRIFSQQLDGDQAGAVQQAGFRLKNLYYQSIPKFGVLYYLNFTPYSSLNNQFVSAVRKMREQDAVTDSSTQALAKTIQQGKTRQNKQIQEGYPLALQEVKSYLLEYGRTLVDLPDQQQVGIVIDWPECKKCQIPEQTIMTVTGEVLRQYNLNKRTLSDAKERIQLLHVGR
ncbi:MAG: hypothetical protein AAF632_27555 [Bacteroidota bacterium]